MKNSGGAPLGVLDYLLTSISPVLLIPKRSWRTPWQQQEGSAFTITAKIYHGAFVLVYLTHFFFVDVPAQKQPLSLWAAYRLGCASLNLIALGLTYTSWHSSSKLNRLSTFLVAAVCVFMQGRSMEWRLEVPFFYVPLLAFFGVLALRLSIISSMFALVSILAISYKSFFLRPDQTHHMISASIALMALMAIIRSRQRQDVIAFIAEQARLETQKELIELQVELSRENLRLEESRKALTQTQNELFRITSQVAHDIRSPLMAMNVISGDLQEVSEEKTLILRTAIRRVNDIISSLTYQNFERKFGHQADKVELSRSVILADCIEQIAAEKRVQYRAHLGIEIITSLEYSSYDIFTVCNEIELRRILSNLINNSLEAISENGNVTISLTSEGGYAWIAIKDSGQGISPAIVQTLGTRGVTFGKKQGSGLGLSHAKAQLEVWGGMLKIEPLNSKGTVVTLAIPTVDRPNWFIDAISLRKVSEVVILDDDPSIHQIWTHRLGKFVAFPSDLKVIHFSSPSEFKEWMRLSQYTQGRVYLMDNEFVGDECKGVDLIREHNLERQAILVTSRYDEVGIQAICEKTGLRMLPKSLVRFIAIESNA